MKEPEVVEEKSRRSGTLMMMLYAVCSSSLSIVNKWAIMKVPLPSLVTFCQFLVTSSVVYLSGKLKILEVETVDLRKLRRVLPMNLIFYGAIFANGKILQYSTVETFIAVRSLTPLLVSLLDVVARGEPRPSLRTTSFLVAIAVGAASYARDDANFSREGYTWAAAYLVIIVTEMVYAKHVISTAGLTTWGLVLYQNLIALGIAPIAAILTGELKVIIDFFAILDDNISPDFFLPLVLSCVLAVGISFAAWGARASISATHFTVLGVACKLATVAINLLVWKHHAPIEAQLSILLCVFASVLYQQSANSDRKNYRHLLQSKKKHHSLEDNYDDHSQTSCSC